MAAFLWDYIFLPVAHWLLVSMGIVLAMSIASRFMPKKAGGGGLSAPLRAKRVELEMQVRRADGTLEEPVVIASSH